MMSPRRWILLLIFYISYLMFGASIYYHIEHNLEKQQRSNDLKERIEINEYLLEQLEGKNETTQNEVLVRISDYCGKPVTDYTQDEYDIPYTWTFYHAFFFAFTVCSTVGYGNISPTTTLGRMIMIVYSVIGIPVNGILFAGLGEYFGKTFQAIYKRYKKYKMSSDAHYVPPKLGLITTVCIALVPGITLFLLLPAWVFTYFEGWPYSLSFYYSYVTTTTIGFGDYVPTFQADQPRKFGGWFIVYEIFIIFWFIFSLGYLVMIMGFITRGLQSKKLSVLEQQLSSNIKATQNRIWNGVTKDVGYLRRILNEMYIMKFKPVYTEPDSYLLHRSHSCPEISMYRVEPAPAGFDRKRAYSECYDPALVAADGTPRFLSASETDLDKFDRQKSFETAEAFRQTTGLLAKVVNALATVKIPEEDTSLAAAGMFGGYHGFSDSQILASELSYGPPQPRQRARSDFYGVGVVNPGFSDEWQMRRPTVAGTLQHNEWTWSGDNNQIQQAINKRYRQRDRENNLYRSSLALPRDYIVHMEEEDENAEKTAGETRKERTMPYKKVSIPDGFRKLFPFNRKRSTVTAAAGMDDGVKRKYSIMSVPETKEAQISTMDNLYSTVSANTSQSYLNSMANGRNVFPSDNSITSRMSAGMPAARRASVFADSEQATINVGAAAPYHRNVAARKRRESTMFAPNPARRGSMFPASTARRGSLFNTERRSSTASIMGAVPPPNRRGSLFPTAAAARAAPNERRPSLFDASADADMDVLENTTLADLIRALEVMHTQAVFEDANNTPSGNTIFKDRKKQRKTSGLEVPALPPIVSLFGGDNNKALTAVAANRLYARRATVMGSLPTTSFGTAPISPLAASNNSNIGNVLSRRRQSIAPPSNIDLPPSYSEQETIQATGSITPGNNSSGNKFRRRFSVRPTALAIPPGKAPPPGSNINLNEAINASLIGAGTAATSPNSPITPTNLNLPTSQTTLQRRLSLRPSPLARELSIPLNAEAFNLTAAASSVSSPNETLPTSPTTSTNSATRLLSPTSTSGSSFPGGLAGPRPSGSTHSPLSRIVQISQAQRKSNIAAEGIALDRNKNADNNK